MAEQLVLLLVVSWVIPVVLLLVALKECVLLKQDIEKAKELCTHIPQSLLSMKVNNIR